MQMITSANPITLKAFLERCLSLYKSTGNFKGTIILTDNQYQTLYSGTKEQIFDLSDDILETKVIYQHLFLGKLYIHIDKGVNP